MENNNQYDKILIKYVSGSADAGEIAEVEKWIEYSEENQRYFTDLKNTWQLAGAKRVLDYVLDEMDLDEKWNTFKQNAATDTAKILSLPEPEQYPELKKTGLKRWLIASAVAASALLVIAFGWNSIFQTKPPAVVVFAKEKTSDTASTPGSLLHEMNNSNVAKTIQLPDGSLVTLASKSEIFYKNIFTESRNIILVGKAFFKVVKDKTRPFTVISGDISTTALGTQFTVTTLKRDKKIIVRLYEGKVVIKPVDITNRLMQKEVYLMPGEQFVYGQKATASTKFALKNEALATEVLNNEKDIDNPVLPQNTEGSWYMFNNQSLLQVLDNLSAFYEVKIEYDKKDIQNIYFTGKYNKTESLDTILKRIGTLNNLKITKKGTAFTITK